MYEIMAKKNNMILAHDNYYGDYFLGTLEQLKSLSCPVNQIGTLKEIKKELTRWKNGVDRNNGYMLEIETRGRNTCKVFLFLIEIILKF